MLRVRDIMSADVVTVAPETTLREAIEVLVNRRITGAPVVSGDSVVGVVSATDILDYAASSPGVPTVQADDGYGEAGVEPEAPDDEDIEAMRYFTDLWSDVGGDVLERFKAANSPEWDRLDEHGVAEIMTRRVAAIEPDVEIDAAADRMLSTGIHRLLVMEGERLVGVVTSTDFVRVVARHIV